MADRASPQSEPAGPPAARSVALPSDVAPLRTVDGGGLAGAAPAVLTDCDITFFAHCDKAMSAQAIADVTAAMARDAYLSEIIDIAYSHGYILEIDMPTKEEARRKRLHEAAQVEGVGL